MSPRSCAVWTSRILVSLFFAIAAVVPAARAQQGTTGTVTITVTDPSGAVVSGTSLELQDLATNGIRKGETSGGGTYSFVGLPIGTYRLTVSKAGFSQQVLDSVIVHAAQVTDIPVALKVGVATEVVEVHEAAAPILDVTSNAISTTIDMKQIESLPLVGRDISQLARLTPGFTRSTNSGGGTWNGLPAIAQGNNVDGIISSTSRMKFSGDETPQVSVRLENIQEMAVQTGDMNLSQGYGQSAMNATFVTRRGSNAFHGRAYEDFRNSYLNANSWTNDAGGIKKPHFELNNFGGSLGGRIIKDKLFFFGSFSESREPGGYIATNPVLSSLAQQGIFVDSSGNQINLFTQVAQPNGLPTTVAAPIATDLASINTSLTAGTVTGTSDPNINQINWFVPNATVVYYPAIRLDYNVSPNVRLDFAWNRTKTTEPGDGQPPFPGSAFSSWAAASKFDFYTNSLGIDWTMTPTMVNQFRGGFLYNNEAFDTGGNGAYLDGKHPFVSWAYGQSPETYNLPTGQYYPLFSLNDNVSWQKGSHSVSFGVSWWREQDHYYNPPDGIYNYSLGLVNGDPAFAAFESYFSDANGYNSTDRGNAENLYATLIGRVSSVAPVGSGFPYDRKTGQYSTSVGAYNLDELMHSWGLYAQDSWRIRPSFTVNYGLRWDFIADNYDLTSAYQSADPSSIWGPSGVNNIFKPGVLTGNMNPMMVARAHQYNPWNVTPQPSLGIAWNPRATQGFWSSLLNGSGTVIRAGFQLRDFTEPQQYFWNNATDHGNGYFQYFSLNAATGGGVGTFAPGTLNLGTNNVGSDPGALPPFIKTPPVYSAAYPMSDLTWNYYWGGAGMNPNIKPPYNMEWNLGIQRQLGSSNVLEVRYLGHRAVREWMQIDPNEVNIFENGFLAQFKQAQTNLAINKANGITSFANNGYAGQAALPIFDAAFYGESAGGTGVPLQDYANPSFTTMLTEGAAGTMAANLALPFGNASYICNLVGPTLTPCNNFTIANPGPYYALNMFQANPYAAGPFVNVPQAYLVNGGYGNYEALQVDFRQKSWHGMQFDANYTWSHTLGLESNNDWLSNTTQFSLRNLRQSYGPTVYDIRHAVHVNGTYDLPFGAGKTYLNRTGLVDKVFGGWNVGSIVTFQTGSPFRLGGGYGTVNDYGDGGLVFNGITAAQLQSAIGIHDIPLSDCTGTPPTCRQFADGIDPKYLKSVTGGGINTSYVTRNTTPGQFGLNPFLYGPHFFNADFALSKSIPITERVRFTFQSEFLNAFNHPNFTMSQGNVTANSFGHANIINSNTSSSGAILGDNVQARQIEFRANLEF